jgi:FtsH-binding integral membrane protein
MRNEVLEKIAQLMTAAFGLIAALAWNTAISALVEKYVPAAGPWVYAILVTILAVLASIWIARAVARAKK